MEPDYQLLDKVSDLGKRVHKLEEVLEAIISATQFPDNLGLIEFVANEALKEEE